MKIFIKLFLFTLLTSSSLSAYLDECQTDLYYANGMFGEAENDEKKDWYIYVKILKKSNSNINSVTNKISYNSHTLWGVDDVIEVMFQKFIGDIISWSKTQDYLKDYIEENEIINAVNILSQAFNIQDLATHIKSYKDSINAGHGVIVVAHSQGNFFTNKAYEYLEGWQKNYFHMIGVASPSSVVSGGGPRVSFDNDLIVTISGADWTIKNENRNRTVDGNDFQTLKYHAFSYYMGETATVTDLGVTKNVSTTIAKDMITNGIVNAVNNHNNAPSQWRTDQEFDKGTIGHKITVKHQYDSSIVMNEEVYPFEIFKKLYYVSGDMPGYVKASCGGTKISPSWTGQEKNELLMINNPEEEKIYGEDEFICTNPASDGHQIMATYCSYSHGSTAHFWFRDTGYINAPASEKPVITQYLQDTYNYCGIYPRGTIQAWGGESYCYEAQVFWDNQ
ncbi:MAG: hypothetical protein COB17_07990 [Sulfurimonas sp.]|nr:MAG: hypothetical protein COB17_07990 [Sulfurimonas sp.]